MIPRLYTSTHNPRRQVSLGNRPRSTLAKVALPESGAAAAPPIDVLLLGLSPSHQIPLQHLLERAGYAVWISSDPETALTPMPHGPQPPLSLVVLADVAFGVLAIAHLIQVSQARPAPVAVVYLVPSCRLHDADERLPEPAAEYIYLPAEPGEILQIVARAIHRSLNQQRRPGCRPELSSRTLNQSFARGS